MFALKALRCVNHTLSFGMCLGAVHEEVCYVNTFNVWRPRDCVAVHDGGFIYHHQFGSGFEDDAVSYSVPRYPRD